MTDIKYRRRSRLLPKIDLTPMVDLGFILLASVLLTTVASYPKVIPILNPEVGCRGEEGCIAGDKLVTLVISGEKRLFGYGFQGLNQDWNITNILSLVELKPEPVRDYLNKQSAIISKNFGTYKDTKPMIVYLKMTQDAKFGDLVCVLNELKRTGNQHYVFSEMTLADAELIQEYEATTHISNSIPKTMEFYKHKSNQ